MSIQDKTWWQLNINEDTYPKYASWIAQWTTPTIRWAIERINEVKATSVVDLGCGTGELFKGLKFAHLDVDYTGVDSCEYYANRAIAEGADVLTEDVRDIVPFQASFVHSRHLLEHLPEWSDVEKVFSLVAAMKPKIFAHTFFMLPGMNEKLFSPPEYAFLHQNTWSAGKLQDLADKYFTGSHINWLPVGGEIIMEINVSQ